MTFHYRTQDDIKALRASSLVKIPLRLGSKRVDPKANTMKPPTSTRPQKNEDHLRTTHDRSHEVTRYKRLSFLAT